MELTSCMFQVPLAHAVGRQYDCILKLPSCMRHGMHVRMHLLQIYEAAVVMLSSQVVQKAWQELTSLKQLPFFLSCHQAALMAIRAALHASRFKTQSYSRAE